MTGCPRPSNSIRSSPSPRLGDWLALTAILAFVGAGVVWSLFGSVPTLVRGSGILISTGGNVFDAAAGGDGSVLEIVPKIGQTVAAGDLVARISQTTLDLTLANANAVIAERKSQLEGRKRQIEQFAVSRAQNMDGRRRALDDRIVSADARAKAVEKQLEVEERMYEQRQITWQKLHESPPGACGRAPDRTRRQEPDLPDRSRRPERQTARRARRPDLD